MHAVLDQRAGTQLQRTMRQSPNPDTAALAALVLQSGMGVSAERLAEEFGMGIDAVRALIVSFNVRRTKALTRKSFGKTFAYEMTTIDRRVIDELIRLTPRAFDLPDNRWLASEIIHFVKEHNLVDGIDEAWIKERLEAARNHRAN